MIHTRTTPTRRLTAVLAVAGLALAACGGDDDDAAEPAPATTEPMTSEPMTSEPMTSEPMTSEPMGSEPMTSEPMGTEPMTSEPMTSEPMGSEPMGSEPMGMALEPSGPGCSAVPTDGEGSFGGMADDPAATAASNNPVLSTLVSAVSQAGLVDTLNSDGPFTIFAPTDDAFAALPAADLDAVLADNDLLTSVLTYHVVAGQQLSSADLIESATVETVNGGTLAIAADGDAFTVNGVPAVCIDVPTANATVHIISGVLLPAS